MPEDESNKNKPTTSRETTTATARPVQERIDKLLKISNRFTEVKARPSFGGLVIVGGVCKP